MRDDNPGCREYWGFRVAQKEGLHGSIVRVVPVKISKVDVSMGPAKGRKLGDRRRL